MRKNDKINIYKKQRWAVPVHYIYR